ncbi:MAG: hypothetical protein WA630_08075 [Mycobacterium sp.]
MLGIPLEDGNRLYELTEIVNTGSIGGSGAMLFTTKKLNLVEQ